MQQCEPLVYNGCVTVAALKHATFYRAATIWGGKQLYSDDTKLELNCMSRNSFIPSIGGAIECCVLQVHHTTVSNRPIVAGDVPHTAL